MLNTSIAILWPGKKKFKTFCQRDGTSGESFGKLLSRTWKVDEVTNEL